MQPKEWRREPSQPQQERWAKMTGRSQKKNAIGHKNKENVLLPSVKRDKRAKIDSDQIGKDSLKADSVNAVRPHRFPYTGGIVCQQCF